MIDFLDELGNFQQKNFYNSKCKFFYILQQQTHTQFLYNLKCVLCSVLCILNVKKISANTFSLIHSNTILQYVASGCLNCMNNLGGEDDVTYITLPLLHSYTIRNTLNTFTGQETQDIALQQGMQLHISTTYC